MALEIERKFLVANGTWRAAVESSSRIVQGYVALDSGVSVRVRIRDGRDARLAVKLGHSALVRDEFEYPVPLADARAMVAACGSRVIRKTRHIITFEGFVWEVDVYEGPLDGLVTAEVELWSETDDPPLPAWVGRELTGNSAWSNARLAERGLPERERV